MLYKVNISLKRLKKIYVALIYVICMLYVPMLPTRSLSCGIGEVAMRQMRSSLPVRETLITHNHTYTAHNRESIQVFGM